MRAWEWGLKLKKHATRAEGEHQAKTKVDIPRAIGHPRLPSVRTMFATCTFLQLVSMSTDRTVKCFASYTFARSHRRVLHV